MGTSCSGYNGLVVLNTYYVMIQTSTISDVSSNKYEILYFNTITYLYFISITLNNLNEYIPSVVTVSNTRYLEIVDTTGTNLQSDYGSPFTLNKVYDITIKNFECDNCVSSNGNGGSLYIIPHYDDCRVYINNFLCKSCSAINGFGGALYLDSYSMTLHHYLQIIDFTGFDCKANDGAAVFISSRFSLSVGKIDNTYISFSYSAQGGIITDFHNTGTLTIENYTSINNSGYFTGIKGYYLSNEVILKVSNLTIANQQSVEAALYFFSSEYNTSIIITNFSISNSNS